MGVICMKMQHDSAMTQVTEIMLPDGSPKGCREGQQAHLLGEDIARALYALEDEGLYCMPRLRSATLGVIRVSSTTRCSR